MSSRSTPSAIRQLEVVGARPQRLVDSFATSLERRDYPRPRAGSCGSPLCWRNQTNFRLPGDRATTAGSSLVPAEGCRAPAAAGTSPTHPDRRIRARMRHQAPRGERRVWREIGGVEPCQSAGGTVPEAGQTTPSFFSNPVRIEASIRRCDFQRLGQMSAAPAANGGVTTLLGISPASSCALDTYLLRPLTAPVAKD